MKWFTEVFLKSLHEKMINHHGQAVTFLTVKQANVCYKYFKPKQCYGDYGYFTNYWFEYNGNSILLSEEGKYCKIYWFEMPPNA